VKTEVEMMMTKIEIESRLELHDLDLMLIQRKPQFRGGTKTNIVTFNDRLFCPGRAFFVSRLVSFLCFNEIRMD